MLETLVKAGIAIDNRDDARNTPLHLAAGHAPSSAAAYSSYADQSCLYCLGSQGLCMPAHPATLELIFQPTCTAYPLALVELWGN